ncbi:hypothetical protein CFC21_077644, partial [Triticum aestivum]
RGSCSRTSTLLPPSTRASHRRRGPGRWCCSSRTRRTSTAPSRAPWRAWSPSPARPTTRTGSVVRRPTSPAQCSWSASSTCSRRRRFPPTTCTRGRRPARAPLLARTCSLP